MRTLFATLLLVSQLSPAFAAENTSGVPARVVEIVQSQYASLQPDQRDHIYSMYRPVFQEFQARWARYARRKKQVDLVLANVASLRQQGDLAAAEEALRAAVTDLQVSSGLPERAFLEPYDAEWPVLQQLARLAVERRSEDYTALPTLLRACEGLWLRRSVGTRDEEMWLYFMNDKRSNPSARMLTNYPEPKRASETLAAERGEGPDAAHGLIRESGLPAALVGHLEERGLRYHDRWPAVFAGTARAIEEFMARWRSYRGRAIEVDAAIASADALVQTGDPARARAVLESVVSPPRRRADGGIDTQRGHVEVLDAELPALRSLERVLAQQKDVRALSRSFAHRFVRRPVGNLEDELGAHIVREGRAYTGTEGAQLARELWTVFEQHGVAFGNQEQVGVKKGTPMLLHINTRGSAKTKLDISAKSIRFDSTIEYFERYDCRSTGEIERIESDGYVRYRVECKTRPKKARFRLDAKLATPAPDWATSDPPRWLYVAGDVVRAGPSWKLVNAEVIDLRFL